MHVRDQPRQEMRSRLIACRTEQGCASLQTRAYLKLRASVYAVRANSLAWHDIVRIGTVLSRQGDTTNLHAVRFSTPSAGMDMALQLGFASSLCQPRKVRRVPVV